MIDSQALFMSKSRWVGLKSNVSPVDLKYQSKVNSDWFAYL